jgi:hypothetical protein
MNLDKEEIAAMTADERKSFLAQVRVDAQLDDRYQQPTVTHRHRMLEEWNIIETKAERDERRAQELEMERDADLIAKRVEDTEALREQREHELRITKTWAAAYANGNGNNGVDVDWAEVLGSINDALTSLVNRVRELEARVSKVEGNNEATTRRLEIASIRADTSADKLSSEWKSEILALKNDIAHVKFRMDVVSAKKNQPQETTSHVIVHQGS